MSFFGNLFSGIRPDKEGSEPSYFASAAADIDRKIKEALDQYEEGSHAPLSEPVRYNILWIGLTHVTYGDLDFQMTGEDRDYLRAVVTNFKESVQEITDHNLDITIDLHFSDDSFPLTKAPDYEWLYLAQETVQKTIDGFTEGRSYDTVLTTIQTAGRKNRSRNIFKAGYGRHPAILGLNTAGLSSSMGYSTFDLGVPRKGTYPLADPKVPSLYATAVAVHEWMHQLEYMGTMLGIEYPNTHAYMGPQSYPGYSKFTADLNDYDFFEFYRLVLRGELPFTGSGDTRLVGMYPKMWPLTKRDLFDLGEFTIRDAAGSGYLNGRTSEPVLTLSDEPCIWNIRYGGNGLFILSPKDLPDKRIDLSNAWDSEGNTVKLWQYSGYDKAQSWKIKAYRDGISIATAYESGRVLTAFKDRDTLLCGRGTRGVQKWSIEPAAAKTT